MSANNYKNEESSHSENDSKSSTEQFMTDDEDDATHQNTKHFDSGNCCYQRRGRRGTKKGHSRTKSEGSYMLRKENNNDDETYGLGNISDNLTNMEMLSNCQK